MKYALFYFLFIALTAFGQTTTLDSINNSIVNLKTSNHINILGSRLFIVPPKGFIITRSFFGLERGENSKIMVTDIIGGNFYSEASKLKDYTERFHIGVLGYKELTVNGYPARCVLLLGDYDIKAYKLLFGDSTFCTTIIATFLPTDEKTRVDIVNALNSICYDTKKVADPFKLAKFILNDKGSEYKYKDYTDNTYLYLIRGTEIINGLPIFTAKQIHRESTETLKSMAEEIIGKDQYYGVNKPIIKSSSSEKINGYETYQIEASMEYNGKYISVYICLVAKGNLVVFMEGKTSNSNMDNLQAFKDLAKTIQLK